jgi:hypothetical protein
MSCAIVGLVVMIVGWLVSVWFVNSALIEGRNKRTDLRLDPENLFGISGLSGPMTDFAFVCWG